MASAGGRRRRAAEDDRRALIKSLARVDAAGLAASEVGRLRRSSTAKPVQNAILLLRGSTTFVLAHEMLIF